MSSDIFTGQIIASVIVLTFLAVFLLREYIAQNARPGVFEDAEMPDVPDIPPVENVAAEVPPVDPVAAEINVAPDVPADVHSSDGETVQDTPAPQRLQIPLDVRAAVRPRPLNGDLSPLDLGPGPSSRAPQTSTQDQYGEQAASLPMISFSSYDGDIEENNSKESVTGAGLIREAVYPDVFGPSSGQSSAFLDDLHHTWHEARVSNPDFSFRSEASTGKQPDSFEEVRLLKRSDSLPINFTPQPLQTFPTAKPLSSPKFGITSTPASSAFRYQYDGQTPQPTYGAAFHTSPLEIPRPFAPDTQSSDGSAWEDSSIFEPTPSPSFLNPAFSSASLSVATPSSVLGLDLLNANVSPRLSQTSPVSNSPFGSAFPSSSDPSDVMPFTFTAKLPTPSTSAVAPRLDPKDLPETFLQQHYAKSSQMQRPPLPTSPGALPDEKPLTTPGAVMYRAPEDMRDVAFPPDYFQQPSTSTAGPSDLQTIKMTPSTTSLPDGEVPSMTPSDYEPSDAADTIADVDEDYRLVELRDNEEPMHEAEHLDIMPALVDDSDDEEEEEHRGHRRPVIDVRLVQGPEDMPGAEAFPQEAVAEQEQNVDIELEEDMDGALEGMCAFFLVKPSSYSQKPLGCEVPSILYSSM